MASLVTQEVLARDEGHGFSKKKDFLFYATVQFVQEHLLK